jgi:hypothetical protein
LAADDERGATCRRAAAGRGNWRAFAADLAVSASIFSRGCVEGLRERTR